MKLLERLITPSPDVNQRGQQASSRCEILEIEFEMDVIERFLAAQDHRVGTAASADSTSR